MIQQDPGDPANYFQLAKLYEDAGVYEAAEQMYTKGKEAKPGDSAGYMQLAGYYNRQGQFDKTIEALEQRASREPNNPEAYYTIATFYWDKAFRDARLKESDKKELVGKGVQADRSCAADQAGLRRSPRLQGPAPAPAGEHGEESRRSRRSCSRKPISCATRPTNCARGRRQGRTTSARSSRLRAIGSGPAGIVRRPFFVPGPSHQPG